jgi:hypothetical protein
MALLFKKVVKVDSADAEATKNMAGKLLRRYLVPVVNADEIAWGQI